jgi:uncharacterized protein (UPF0276 family)
MSSQSPNRPVVGLLYNPAVPAVIDYAGELVEYIEVIPDRLWYDFGITEAHHGRFHKVHGAIDTLKRCAEGRTVAAHAIGLSLPSAMPLDTALLEQMIATRQAIGFAWFSEHLSMFLTPHGSVPNAQAGLGIPVLYNEETFAILRDKLQQLQQALDCQLLLENGSIFTPIPEMELTEPEFLRRLYRELNCATLLDLHNLHVSARNGSGEPQDYLEALDPDSVFEIHLAGGDELAGFYTDSHSRFTPPEVWSLAFEYVPRFPNLRAIMFEFHESYYARLGNGGIACELEKLRELAATVRRPAMTIHAG